MMPGPGRKIFLSSVIAVFCLVLVFNIFKGSGDPGLTTGDIIFQDLPSAQSEAVRLATGSQYSHVGMIVEKEGRLLVLEAIGPVLYTPMEEWVERGGGHFAVKRYRLRGNPLDAGKKEQLVVEGEKLLGIPYDPYFLWSDERVYCSELVYKT